MTPVGENSRKRVYVATFGCQMNDYDSTRLLRLLEAKGYDPTEEPREADLVFVNTCAIREKAEQKVYSLLGRLSRLKADRPDMVLGVGGCVAQHKGAALLDRIPALDLVAGSHHINRLPEMVERVTAGEGPVCEVDFNYDLKPAPAAAPYGRVKAFLTIMQGCDNFCAYCVVPYVRGREVSRPSADVEAEARALAAGGVREITLLGQNVNSYGRKLAEDIDFPRLLRRLAAIDGLWRLRFTTSHPKDLSADLIACIAELGEVCEHLHLPVQSGSSKVLEAMGRGYDREAYLAKVDALRAACPDIALTTDVIVGFPGETEADFEQTLSLAEAVRYDGMYSFKYSDRPGARAATLPGKVDEAVKKRRLTELQALQKGLSLKRNQMLVGRRVEALVEDQSGRYDGQLTGRTRTAKIVNFNGPESMIGRLVEVHVLEAYANSLRGKAVGGPK